MRKTLSFMLTAMVVLCIAACILPLTAETAHADSTRYSFYYAPSDEQLAAECKYQIWMKNTTNAGYDTGGNLWSYSDRVSCNNREVFGFRSGFDFTTTAEFWVKIMDKDNNEVSRLTFTNVNLNTFDNKVIYPDKSLHDLDTFTYTLAYAPTDLELQNDCDYSIRFSDTLQDDKTIEVELSKPDSIRHYAVVPGQDDEEDKIRRAAVGTVTTNFKTTDTLQVDVKYKDSGSRPPITPPVYYDYEDGLKLSDFNNKVIMPDKTLLDLHTLLIPEEDPSEGIAPPEGDPKKPDLDPVDPKDYELGGGYIRADEGEDSTEIVNLFYDPVELNKYKGMSYDISTNTLTLDNVQGSKISLFNDQMNCLKIKLVGNSTLKSLYCWDTYPIFTGSGTLNVTGPVEVYIGEKPFRAGIKPVTVEKTATVTFNGSKDESAVKVSVQSYDESISTDSLIDYSTSSPAPAWKEDERTGGITENTAVYSGVRYRTKFNVSELLTRVDGTGSKYYVKSIANVGYDPVYYHHIYPLAEKDGIWYEDTNSEYNWGKDELFRPLTADEIKAIPETLANSSGTVTAYLSIARDYCWAYKKDKKVFLLSYEGRTRNLLVNPVYPIISIFQRDEAPFMVMRAVKEFTDGDNEIILVRTENEYDLEQSGDEKLREALLKAEGYEHFTRKVFNPYEYVFHLTNSKITFGTGKPEEKKANTIKVTPKTATVKFKSLKKKNQTVAVKNAMTVSKAKGTVTYQWVGGEKKIMINKKTGKLTVKKGLKKKTYKVKIKVTAAGNSTYKSGSKTVTVKIKVK